MGRRRKSENGAPDTPPAPGGNVFNAEAVQGFVQRIEHLYEDKQTEHMSYMALCRDILSDIKLVFDEAKESGIPRKALRSVIRARELERRAKAVRNQLEDDDQDSHDKIRQALGDLADTPLGQNVIRQTFGEAPLDPAA